MGKHTEHTIDIRLIPRVCPLSHLSRDWQALRCPLDSAVASPTQIHQSFRPSPVVRRHTIDRTIDAVQATCRNGSDDHAW